MLICCCLRKSAIECAGVTDYKRPFVGDVWVSSRSFAFRNAADESGHAGYECNLKRQQYRSPSEWHLPDELLSDLSHLYVL
jgi:hypothetical protein